MSFDAQIKLASGRIKQSPGRIIKAAAIEIFSSTVKDTPVDTGRLAGNWQLSEGQPSLLVFEDARKEGAAAQQRNFEQSLKVTGDVEVYITNNLPYAGVIEFGDGKSRKPVGMLRRNFARVKSIIDKHSRRERSRK
jgi:hypothetical protein